MASSRLLILHVCAIDIAGDGFVGAGKIMVSLETIQERQIDAPVAIKSNISGVSLSAGVRSSCGITTENELYCWGAGGRL